MKPSLFLFCLLRKPSLSTSLQQTPNLSPSHSQHVLNYHGAHNLTWAPPLAFRYCQEKLGWRVDLMAFMQEVGGQVDGGGTRCNAWKKKMAGSLARVYSKYYVTIGVLAVGSWVRTIPALASEVVKLYRERGTPVHHCCHREDSLYEMYQLFEIPSSEMMTRHQTGKVAKGSGGVTVPARCCRFRGRVDRVSGLGLVSCFLFYCLRTFRFNKIKFKVFNLLKRIKVGLPSRPSIMPMMT